MFTQVLFCLHNNGVLLDVMIMRFNELTALYVQRVRLYGQSIYVCIDNTITK